jgi:D-alanyl-D-alanine carboxypeptidase
VSRARPSLVAAASVSLVIAAAAAGTAGPGAGGLALEGGFEATPVTSLEEAVDATDGPVSSESVSEASIDIEETPPPVVTEEPQVSVLGPGRLAGFDAAAFDSKIADPLLNSGALSVSIAVAKDGRLIHAAAYGVADPATGESPTAASRYRIASNSKMLTATTALILVERGDLTLDEPGVLIPLAEQFGVEFGDGRMADVTLRQLLSHTSGLADFSTEFFRGKAVSCEDATVEALLGGLSGTPGGNFNYSNMNFCITGLLIEIASGLGYEQAVGDLLLTPLGITTARTTGNGDRRSGEVVHLGNEERNFMEVLGGAGSWIASAEDMVKFVDSLDTSRPGWHPLSPEMAADMQGLGPLSGMARSHQFGLGLRVFNDGTWGHTGTISNAHSMIIHQPNGYTWAVLVSGEAPSETDNIRNYVERAFGALGVPPESLGTPEPFSPFDVGADDRLFNRLDLGN